MKYLLDTHTFLWLASVPEKLSDPVLRIVSDSENELVVSAATGWETALLWKLGRVELPEEPALLIPQVIQALALTPLAISFETATAAATLPLIHRDPFDRLLVAAAILEKIPILSRDRLLAEYGVEVVW